MDIIVFKIDFVNVKRILNMWSHNCNLLSIVEIADLKCMNVRIPMILASRHLGQAVEREIKVKSRLLQVVKCFLPFLL